MDDFSTNKCQSTTNEHKLKFQILSKVFFKKIAVFGDSRYVGENI